MSAIRPFTDIMVHSEISVLRSLHCALETKPVQTRAEFIDLMKAAFEYGRLDPRRLADDLGYSFSTVYRWIDGRSAPHPSLWPRIVEWTKETIDARIDEHEGNGT
jgi:predicted DNA-binding transcriptional regulator AlpA